LVRQARYGEASDAEAQLNASMTLLTTKRVKKRRQQQPENLADWSEANRTVSIRASIIRVWVKGARASDRLAR